MALRFRTRLSLTISALLILTVAALTVVTAGIHVVDLSSLGYDRGRDLTILANRNIEFGVDVPQSVMRVVDEQMIVQALLVSELVALAEQPGAASRSEVEAALARVIERSKDVSGEPLVDSFRILDEEGDAVVRTGSGKLIEPGAGTLKSDEEFNQLLEPGAKPVVKELPADENFDQPFKYVGVSGAEQPRIVQVGASQEVLKSIQEQFGLEDLLDRFMLPQHFNRVAVVDASGRVLAAVDAAGNRGAEVTDTAVARACENYLAGDQEEPGFIQSGRSLAVITSLGGDDDDDFNYALYIEYGLADDMQYVWSRISRVLTVGGVMILVGVLVAMFLSRSLAKPIVALTKGAREFGQGNLSYRIYFKRKDEFQGLAQGFNTMAISLQEHMHELEQETALRERLESEFRIAAEMQRALLPDAPPEVEGLELAGYSKPSREVGGDFYDYFDMKNGLIGVALGDATGKGVPAALLTTECASILRTLAHEHTDPAELLRRTSEALHLRAGQTHRFVTLYLLILDPATGRVAYSAAGHPSPVVIPADGGKARWLDSSLRGYPLGILRDADYEAGEHILNPGDALVMFSDGLSEARNPEDEMYGERRIINVVGAGGAAHVETLLRRLREDAERFMNGREPFDDLTLVGLRYTGTRKSA